MSAGVQFLPQVSFAGSAGIAKNSRNVMMLIATSITTMATHRRSVYWSTAYPRPTRATVSPPFGSRDPVGPAPGGSPGAGSGCCPQHPRPLLDGERRRIGISAEPAPDVEPLDVRTVDEERLVRHQRHHHRVLDDLLIKGRPRLLERRVVGELQGRVDGLVGLRVVVLGVVVAEEVRADVRPSVEQRWNHGGRRRPVSAPAGPHDL